MFFPFESVDQISDPFETGKGIVTVNVIAGGKYINEVGCYNGFTDIIVRLCETFAFAGFYDIIEKQYGGLVAVQQYPAAGMIFHGNAYTIRIPSA